MEQIPGRVSVLIPLYNRVKYIKETLESALQQDYNDIEIICVDDGSVDGGDKVVEGYLVSGKVQLIRHPNNANCGQSVSLNLALSLATGEYIVVLDSDDIFLPAKLKNQAQFLHDNPDVGLVYGMGFGIDAQGKELYEILSPEHQEPSDPNRVLLDCYFHLPVGSLVRHSVYDRVGGFDTSLRAGQDHDMMIRMAEVTKFAFQPIRVYCYRRHAESISTKGLEARWRNAQVILDKAASRYPYQKTTLRKRRAVINFRLAQALISSRKAWGEAAARLCYAALLDPARVLRVISGAEKIN
jgi:glycosyltransferase involved in cell wall biosynthesis